MGAGIRNSANLEELLMANLLGKDFEIAIFDAKVTKGTCGESQENGI